MRGWEAYRRVMATRQYQPGPIVLTGVGNRRLVLTDRQMRRFVRRIT